MIRAWFRPRAAFADVLGSGNEARALGYLMGGSAILALAQLPGLGAQAGPDRPLEGLVAGILIGGLLIAPLVFYLVAGAVHVILRFFGAKHAGVASRLACFWALFHAAPLVLLQAAAAHLGALATAQVLGLIAGIGFVAYWVFALRVAIKEAAG